MTREKRSPLGRATAATVAVLATLPSTLGLAGAAPAQAASAGGDSPSTATVPASASSQIAVSKTSVYPEGGLKVTGNVPAKSYRAVQLQAATGTTDAWTKIGKSQTSRTGKFVFKFQAPATPGTIRYRVHAPKIGGAAQTTMAAVSTRAVTVTVIDPPGSRTNPYTLGETFRVGDWTITVHSTDYDSYPESDHDIVDPPEAGWTYISYGATFTFSGENASRPDMDLAIDFLAADNRVYDEYSGDNNCGNAEPDLDDVGDMYAGATVTGNDCVSVPSTLAHDGLWRFEAYLGDREFFVRAN